MKKGEKILRRKKEEEKKKKKFLGIKISSKKAKTVIPTYDMNGRDITPGKKERDLRTAIILLVVSAILLFIYLPGFFIKEPYKGEITIQPVAPDGSAIKKMTATVRSNMDADFDEDGITNADEGKYNTNLWNVDTDGDGAYDLYEINISKTDPTKYNNEVLNDIQTKIDEEKGASVGTPYKIGNVTLWAADYTSKAHGSVIETTRGYRFSNFTGYAQFPEEDGVYAYRVANGTRELLKYREKEKVWEIHPYDEIELYHYKLEEIVEMKLFKKYFYLTSNKFTRIVAKILPNRGFVCAKLKMRKDVEPDISDPVIIEVKKPVYDSEDGYRYTLNTNTINALQYVRKTIADKNTCIAVSLFNRNYGEFIAIVYGYTASGNLLLADIDTLQPIGVLGITERAVKVVTNDGEMMSRSYFDFDGFGFHSYNNDRISFFAASSGSVNGDFNTEEKQEVKEDKNTKEPEESKKEKAGEGTTEQKAAVEQEEDTEGAENTENAEHGE